MFNKKCGLLLTLLLLLVSVSSVCATDNNTGSLTPVGDNSLELNNTLCGSDDVDLTNNETTNTVSNDSVDLSTVPCAVSSYIDVMNSYNKTVDVETGIKETETVNNTTSILGLTNAFTNQGLKCNVIKTKSIEDLTTLYKDKKLNIIVHMFIDNQYHFGHIKEIKKDGILFADTLKPKMINLVKIQKKLKPIYNNPKASPKLLSDLNNILTPMQTNLNETIRHLNYLNKLIKEICNDNLKYSSNVVSPKVVDVPKLLGDGCNLFIDNLKESINNLNPLNARPEWREYFDEKYGLDHHQFGFFEYYTLKSI